VYIHTPVDQNAGYPSLDYKESLKFIYKTYHLTNLFT